MVEENVVAAVVVNRPVLIKSLDIEGLSHPEFKQWPVKAGKSASPVFVQFGQKDSKGKWNNVSLTKVQVEKILAGFD